MKAFILICLMLNLSFISFAQEGVMVNPNGLATDTLTNTTAEGPTVRIPGVAEAVSFTLQVTTISGTLGGKVYLRGASKSGVYGDNYLDSVTLQAGTKNYTFSRVNPGHQYYQMYVVPTGTSSSAYKASYYIRKD